MSESAEDKGSQVVEQPQISQLQRVQQWVQLHEADQLATLISSHKYGGVTAGKPLRQECLGPLSIWHLRQTT